jgi:DNA mismatch endonuclease (patch repair protein)
MDRLTPKQRSENMSRIRAKDTRPERVVRSALHRLGYRFRVHRKDLPGTPDIVLPKHRLVIFVHGCFWHRHPRCRMAYMPKTRVEFWRAKFEKNIRHDKDVLRDLKREGWTIMVVWECQTQDTAELVERMVGQLSERHGERRTCRS